ncbi:glycosyltransferase [Mycolicibacterium sp.]|uniref:glycosyltransferase family 2 protein n=1 Tax=Mycolicibacterium sp. TaxID=2320850 RepID=UPI0028AA4A5A|nr:glycosyltransferase [Mycolicibacterium sp.]
MPLLSLITPVLPRASEWLTDAWRSLDRQRMPPGWDWEFLLQIDGEGELAADLPRNDPRIRVARNDRSIGPAMSRNMALGRASGQLVKPLDADDMLPPDTLAREVDVFLRFPETGWVVSKTLDLRPDGTTIPNPLGMAPVEGPLQPGVVFDTVQAWEQHPGYPPPPTRGAGSEPDSWWAEVIRDRTERGLQSAPLHPAAMMARTNLVVMLGGWPGLWSSEDWGLLLALETVSPGHFLSAPGLLYREWPESLRASAKPADPQVDRTHQHLNRTRILELRRWVGDSAT